jgi:hypothetical protein
MNIDPIASMRDAMVFDTRDWSVSAADAWLYGIVVGWGSALAHVAARHGWNAEACARLLALHEATKQLPKPSARECALAMERAGVPSTMIRTPDGRINNCAIAAGYPEAECSILGSAQF